MTMMDPNSQDNYYGMNFWQQMLGMAGNPYYQYYQAPKMKYIGMGGQQGQGQQQKQGGNINPNMLRQLMASQPTQTGMTTNATNSMGESYYGWGAQTGDWGATAGASTPGSATVGNGLVAGNEITSAVPLSEMGADLGMGVGAEGGASAGGMGGMATAAAPYGALAAALGAFKLNDNWMSKGSGKTFGGEMQDAFSESFGNEGWWGLIKGLF